MLIIDKQLILSEEAYQNGLKKAEAFHGHLCPGMFTGVKMSLLAQKLLKYDLLPSKDLIIIAEIDRCLTDAIMSFTGCRLGRRTMKFRDYGKFAATFCSLSHRQGIRIATQQSAFSELEKLMQERGIDPKDKEKAAGVFLEYPWQNHFSLNVLDISWNENDLPGFPKVKEVCCVCREPIMDARHLIHQGKTYCHPCLESQHPSK